MLNLEWKIYQDIYLKLSSLLSLVKLDLGKETYNPDIINSTIEFFKNRNIVEYPAKNYAVAIIYAKRIEQKYKNYFFVTLADYDLLRMYDKQFVPYGPDSASIYDTIIERLDTEVPGWSFFKEGNPFKVSQQFYHECTREGIHDLLERTLAK